MGPLPEVLGGSCWLLAVAATSASSLPHAALASCLWACGFYPREGRYAVVVVVVVVIVVVVVVEIEEVE